MLPIALIAKLSPFFVVKLAGMVVKKVALLANTKHSVVSNMAHSANICLQLFFIWFHVRLTADVEGRCNWPLPFESDGQI